MYKDIILQHQQLKMVGMGLLKQQIFGMVLRLYGYKFKLECYNFRMLNIIPMKATKIELKNTVKRKWETNLTISP